MSKLSRRQPFSLSPLVIGGLVTAAAALLAIWIEMRAFERDVHQERIYQVREVQEGLAALHRDLMTVSHLATTAPDHHESEATEYLTARREAFEPVRWLGYVEGSQQRPKVLLTTADARGYDPRRDASVAAILGRMQEGDLAAALPAGYRNVASLALVVGPLDGGEATLVALVDGDDLLDDSLRALARINAPFTLLLNDSPIGHWPPTQPQNLGESGPRLPVSVATLDFTLQFSPTDWGLMLRQVAPLPIIVVLTGLLVMGALHRLNRGMPAPPLPPAMAAAPASQFHRTRLWQLGELAASMSHDLGQPLNVIRLAAEAAAEAVGAGRLEQEKLGRTLGNVVDQTLRAQHMLDTLVSETRRPTAAPTALAVCLVVRQALADHQPKFKAHGVQLRWHPDLSAPAVSGHAHRLAAAVRHLLDNACEALSAHRLETGHAGTVHVRCRRHGDGVAIEVVDDGPGFPAALRPALTDSSTIPQGVGNGFGLGLAVALGVAAEMGGTLTIADERPGTRVTITLPPLRRSLLLVEDDAAAATELAAALGGKGWHVRVAHGGNPALALFRQHGADAVVTDLHMPDGDGWHLIERLRASAPDLPIIAISTADGPEARRAVEAGAALVLRKPIAAHELVTELGELLGEGP